MVSLQHLDLVALVLLLPVVATSVLRFDIEKDGASLNRTKYAQWFSNTKPTDGHSLRDPKQCQRLACPPNTLIQDKGSYQLRLYPVAPYAKSNLVSDSGFLRSTIQLYSRLHNYFHGENDKKESLPMTAPVILRMDIDEDKGLWEISNYTLFFYIDPKVRSPPKPADDTVEVVDVNEYEIYIRTFSGYPVTYGDWMRELLTLYSDLEADGQPHVKSWFYFASYDSPLTLTGRVNEVQILKPHDTQ